MRDRGQSTVDTFRVRTTFFRGRRSVTTAVVSIVFFPVTIAIYFRSRHLATYGETPHLDVLGYKNPSLLSKSQRGKLYDLEEVKPLSDDVLERYGLGEPSQRTDFTTPQDIASEGSDKTDDVIRFIKGLEL